MKPPLEPKLEVETTMTGERVVMDIDRNSLGHIMKILSGLYRDILTAMVREYACNAWDSHVLAGNSMPIEITMPTQLEPTLRIRDYGVGLDADDIRDVYSHYGLSTKTHSNDFTGSLGLGSKSGLAYTHQFTVVGIKDRVRTIVTVSKNEEGIGEMLIVDTSETGDANGVEVIIPIKQGDHDALRGKVDRLFRFWDEGMVLIDGQAPARIEDGLLITPEIRLRQHVEGSTEPSYVVMGNVPYAVPTYEFDFDLPAHHSVIITVPLGTVSFVPSRDALDISVRHTTKALASLRDTIRDELRNAINREIDAAATMPEALRVAMRWGHVLGNKHTDLIFTYKGVELPRAIFQSTNNNQRFIVAAGEREFTVDGNPYRVGAHSAYAQIDLRMVDESIWVYEFDRGFSPACKKRLWLYCEQHGIDVPKHFVMTVVKPSSPWIAPERMIPWAEVASLKLPRKSADGRTLTTDRLPGSYDLWYAADGQMEFMADIPPDDIDTSVPVYYIVGGKEPVRHSSRVRKEDRTHVYVELLHKLEDDFVIVKLSHNRVAKFCRFFQTRPLMEVLREYYHLWWTDTLNGMDRELLSFAHNHGYGLDNWAEIIRSLGLRRLYDPELRRFGQMAAWRKQDPRVRHLYAQFQTFRSALDVNLPEWSDERSPLKRYPLFRSHSYREPRARYNDHLRLYLNTAYLAQRYEELQCP